ncbi:MAG: iron-containing alcohol dehydrogenase PsrA [Syntrophobacteraceae bacterium]
MMESWSYYNPVRLHFGQGSLDRLPAVISGRKALVLTFPEASQTDLLHRLEELAGDSLVGILDGIPPLPAVSNLEPLYNLAHREAGEAEVIVAVGGGSVIDTAKVLATIPVDRTFESLLEAIRSNTVNSLHTLPVVAIPTTAGTGSEVTPWATIWDWAAGVKLSLHHPGLFPETALIEPGLSITLPAGPTLASGLDALSHALEAVWNKNANPVSDQLAKAAAREVLVSLPLLMKRLCDPHLRAKMAYASLMAGLAFSNTQTALAHSISYPLTLRHNVAHGIACSFCLPLVLRKALGVRPDRDEVLSHIFDDDPALAPIKLEVFLNELGVGTDFSTYGVTQKEAGRIIEQAADGSRGLNFIRPQ